MPTDIVWRVEFTGRENDGRNKMLNKVIITILCYEI